MDIPLRGNLKDFSLPRILIELNRNGATGTFSVATPRFTKNIYMKDGNVIFASSTFEDDRLGEMLVKAGKISMEQYDKSVELLKETGRRQGAILVELGYITPKDLFWGVKYQVKEIIYSIFRLEDGSYEFRREIPPNEVITLKISIGNLIYEGVKLIDNWTRIRKETPDVDTVFTLNEDPAGIFRGIDLTSQDRIILSLVDGERTTRQLIEESHMNSFDVMKTLYVLWSTGFITERNIQPGIKSGETRAGEVFESAEKEDVEVMEEADEFCERPPEIGDSKRAESIGSPGPPSEEGEDTQAVLLEEQFKRGIEEFKKGNFWGASELFRLVARKNPDNPKAWSYLSLALTRIPNRMREAEEALMEAMKLEPFNSDHFANLGLLYLKIGLKTRAKQQFEKTLRLDPENTKARKGLEQTG